MNKENNVGKDCSGSKAWKASEQATSMEQLETALPYSQVSRIKILGMVFDQSFSFEEHLDRILEKAKTRLAVLNKVTSCSW